MSDISYTRTTWADGSEGGTPIDATKLNNIEQGIVDAVAAIGPNDVTSDGTLQGQIETLRDSVSLNSVYAYEGSYGIVQLDFKDMKGNSLTLQFKPNGTANRVSLNGSVVHIWS